MSSTTTEHRYWEDRAETLDEDSEYIVGEDVNDAIKAWLRRQFAPTDAVLELGCGTGVFSEAVAPFVNELVATDLSESMLRQAEAKLGEHRNVRFQQEDAYRLEFAASAFDAVLMVNLLHIVHDPAVILQECSRVLKVGGKIVVSDITSQGTPWLAGLRLGLRYLKRWGRPPASSQNIRIDQLVRLAHGAGFAVEERALVGSTVKAACVTGTNLGPAGG